MQTFGETNNNSGQGGQGGKSVTVGQYTVKIVRASSLSLGVHAARFYPLSPEFYQGADYPFIVQSFHWLNKQPVLCRRTSYDYTVPDTHQKPLVDTQCPICVDKFAWYAKAKELGYTRDAGYAGSPPASVECHKTAKNLNERIGCASLVSFVENGMLAFPVIITYGKELMDQIQFHAKRIEDSSGINICDPQRGYMFDIIIGHKQNSKQRDYKNSAPSVNMVSVDVTGNAWKWEEVCQAIKSEIVPIPSPDQVREFYINNYNGNNSNSQFVHPAFQNQAVGVNNKVPDNDPNNYVNHSNPNIGADSNQSGAPVNPANPVNNGGAPVNPANPINNGGAPVNPVNNVPVFTPPSSNNNAVFPCHASLPSGSGYDEQDANCKGCAQAQTCFDAKSKKINVQTATSVANPVNNGGAVVNPTNNGGAVVNPANPVNNGGAPVNPANPVNNVPDDVQSRLAVLNNDMQNQ